MLCLSEKKLGFGLMRLPHFDPNDRGDFDHEQVNHMVDEFLKNGFTYFDTAWMYCKEGDAPGRYYHKSEAYCVRMVKGVTGSDPCWPFSGQIQDC